VREDVFPFLHYTHTVTYPCWQPFAFLDAGDVDIDTGKGEGREGKGKEKGKGRGEAEREAGSEKEMDTASATPSLCSHCASIQVSKHIPSHPTLLIPLHPTHPILRITPPQ
jgi:hypothetical protein